MGVEITGRARSVGEAIENVFAAISAAEAKEMKAGTILLPLLGAGYQQIEPEVIIRHLLPKALEFLKRSATTSRICFASRFENQAEKLNQAMNELLGSVRIVLPKGPFISDLRREITTSVYHLRASPIDSGSILADLERIIASETSQSFEIGIVARRLVEHVVDDVLGSARDDIDLYAHK